MSYNLPPITLVANQTNYVTLPGNLGSVSWVKIVNASPYLVSLSNIANGQDYLQPGEANVWPVDGLTSAIQATPTLYGISPTIIPSSVLIVTWYLNGEQPSGRYPVNFSALSYLGNTVTSTSAANAFEQDFLTPFVLTGLVSTKDGVTANQLDTTSGIAFLIQSDSSVGRVAPLASTQLTSTINTTYFLDLNPDGTWSFATTHSAVANYLPIASCTTDGSGNILVVTDARTLNSVMLTNASGPVEFPASIGVGPAVGSSYGLLRMATPTILQLLTPQSGVSAIGQVFNVWNGSTGVNVFSLGGQFGSAMTWLGTNGNVGAIAGQATAGSFGVPVIVAQALRTSVTATTAQTVLSFTPSATGLYRISGHVHKGNATANALSAFVTYNDPDGGTGLIQYFATVATGVSTLSPVLMDGANSFGTGRYGLLAFTVEAASGAAITCTYQDPSGTPADFVTFVIERMA